MPDAKLRIDESIYDVGMNVNSEQFTTLYLRYNEMGIFRPKNTYSRTYTDISDVVDDVQDITVGKVEQIDGVEPCAELSEPNLWEQYLDAGDGDPSPEAVFNALIDALVDTSDHVERV